MTGSHSRQRRPTTAVAAALAVAVVGAAGGTAAWAYGPDAVTGAEDVPIPAVTVTAEPGAASPGSGIAAVTAPDVSMPLDAPSVTAVLAFDIDDPASVTVVVNKTRPLEPLTFAPADLVALTGIPGGGSQRMRTEAADALQAMHVAAADAGAGFSVSTAYRAFGFQQSLFSDYSARRGVGSAETFSARPGYSEHQTGLAVDIYASSACRIKRCFGDEAAGQWVAEHGWEYGFVVRYPRGQQDVTGYVYEPWHVRYVGTDLAAALEEGGAATLEEHLGLPAAPDYD
ncbi:M15 family metallopeptidase [Demequina sp. NBRC 110051]|uniref:M15 family metallopeptidase n=1 Tax=Demequina sp. NBRC 110051 TaxID=1570340 RepID=UPI000A001C2A|nr:M15 family metallopeptidase [Demequina sp. NBRC 110051]